MEPIATGRGIVNRDLAVKKGTLMKRFIFYAFIFFVLGLGGCTGGGSETAVSEANPTPATMPTAAPTDTPEMTGAENCPTTQPPESPFVPPEPYPETAPSGGFWYGTNELWTDLRTGGIWYGLPKTDTGYGNKIALWHEGYSQTEEPQPEITLSAQRLDGEAAVEPIVYGTNAYHPDYGQFMMTGITLPALGCWEISAEYKEATLSFIVWVAP